MPLEQIHKEDMFKIPDSGFEVNIGAAVKLVNLELIECDLADDHACLGLLGAFHLTTDVNFPTVKDCLGNIYTRETNKEKTVYKIIRVGLIHTAKLCDEGGSIAAGDLLCTSSVPGYLKKQSDLTVHAKTVGQAITNISFTNGKAENQSIYLLG